MSKVKPKKIIDAFLNIMKCANAARHGVFDLLHFASLANG